MTCCTLSLSPPKSRIARIVALSAGGLRREREASLAQRARRNGVDPRRVGRFPTRDDRYVRGSKDRRGRTSPLPCSISKRLPNTSTFPLRRSTLARHASLRRSARRPARRRERARSWMPRLRRTSCPRKKVTCQTSASSERISAGRREARRDSVARAPPAPPPACRDDRRAPARRATDDSGRSVWKAGTSTSSFTVRSSGPILACSISVPHASPSETPSNVMGIDSFLPPSRSPSPLTNAKPLQRHLARRGEPPGRCRSPKRLHLHLAAPGHRDSPSPG